MKITKIIIKILLVILCMSTIFCFSRDSGVASSKKSDGFIIKLMTTIKNRKLTEKEKETYREYLVKPVRKSAHFVIYFILGLLVISLLSEFFVIDKRIVIYTIIICLIYASSDEIHQLFVEGRSGQITDVLLDTIASSISSFIYLKLKTRKINNMEK